MRDRSAGFAALFLLCGTVLSASPAPEAIEYPVDHEMSRRILGEETEVVAYRDPVVLTDNNRWVKSIGENGYFYVKKRLLIQTVVITGRPTDHAIGPAGDHGEVDLRLWINNIRRRYPENHTRLVGDVLQEAAAESGLGAAAAVSRLYAEDGIDAVFEATRWIKDQSIRKALIERFILDRPLDGPESIAVLDWALPTFGDDEKAEVIISFAEKLYPSEAVTVELLTAARGIVSGSTKAETVIRVAEIRGLSDKSAAVALQTAKSVPSADAKRAALIKLVELGYISGEAVDTYIDTSRTIPSSDDKAAVLKALLDSPVNLTPRQTERLLSVTQSIPSSDEKSRLLLYMLRIDFVTASYASAYLSVVRTIPASNSKRNVLMGFVSKMDTDHSLKNGLVLRETLKTVITVPASDDKTEVLLAILSLHGLDDVFLAEVAEFATRYIAGSNDRERVLKAVIQYRR